MERIESESVGLFFPELADEFVWREAFEGLEPPGEIVCGDEIRQMNPQLSVRFIEISFDGCILDGAVYALDLPIRPWMLGFRQPMIDFVAGAGEFKSVRAERTPLREHLLDFRGGPGLAARVGEVRAIVGEHCVDSVGNGLGQRDQKIGGDSGRGFLMQLDEGEL
jgi:hypothetical protein